MDDNERTIRIDELYKYKEELLKGINNNDIDKFNDDTSNSKESAKVMVKSSGIVTGINSDNNLFSIPNDKKTGMVNVIMLATMTFVFESLFLFLSFMLYK